MYNLSTGDITTVNTRGEKYNKLKLSGYIEIGSCKYDANVSKAKPNDKQLEYMYLEYKCTRPIKYNYE